MKKIIIIFWCLVLVSKLIDGQERKIITNDSLVKMFQVMKPFEVFDKVQFSNFDFKSCYYDTLVKPFLMKWLDRDEYFRYTIDKERETITNRPDLIRDEILYMLIKQGQKNILDSVMNNPALYSHYRDSAVSAYVNRYIGGR